MIASTRSLHVNVDPCLRMVLLCFMALLRVVQIARFRVHLVAPHKSNVMVVHVPEGTSTRRVTQNKSLTKCHQTLLTTVLAGHHEDLLCGAWCHRCLALANLQSMQHTAINHFSLQMLSVYPSESRKCRTSRPRPVNFEHCF